MLTVRDAEGLKDSTDRISNNIREIATNIYSKDVSFSDVSGLLMMVAVDLDSCVNKYVEVED